MSRSVRHSLIFAVIAVVIGGAVCLFLPEIMVKKLPDYLQTHMVPFLHIESAEYKKSPPELILHEVRLSDPEGFDGTDAFRVDRINVTFERNPFWGDIQITNITFHRVRGEYKVRGKANNFAILLQRLMERKGQTPRGLLAKPATLQEMTIYRSSVQNEKATSYIPLADRDYAPTGALTDAVPLQNIIADTLGTMIQHEQEAVAVLEVQEIKEKTKGLLKSLGDSVKEYLTTP